MSLPWLERSNLYQKLGCVFLWFQCLFWRLKQAIPVSHLNNMVLALELDQFQGQTGINTKGDNFWKKGCDLLVELGCR